MKNLSGILEFVDNTIGGLWNLWGSFATLFFYSLPFIFLLAAIKWAVSNGYI